MRIKFTLAALCLSLCACSTAYENEVDGVNNNVNGNIDGNNDESHMSRDTSTGTSAGSALTTQILKDFTRFTLPNGLTCYIKEQHDVPNVAVAIAYRVGSYDEPDGMKGSSHLLEHMMFKTTKKYKVGDIDKIAFKGGGISNAYTSNDATVYYFKLNADKLRDVLEVEADRMTNIIFIEKEFERETRVVLEELNRQQDTPWGLLLEGIYKLAFTKSPYMHPVIGYRQDLELLSSRQLMEYYKKYYTPSNATLVIIGDVKTAEAASMVKQLFSDIPSHKLDAPATVLEPEQTETRRTSIDLPNAAVPRVVLAYRTETAGSKVDLACDVIDTLLTGYRTAILNRVIVEQKKLVREGGISAFNNSEPFNGSLLIITFEPNPGHDPSKSADEIATAIETELQKTTEEDLRKAKNIVQADFIYQNEALQNLGLHVAHMAATGNLETFTNYLDLIEGITLEDIRETASKYLTKNRANILVGIPKGDTGTGGGTDNPDKNGHRRAYYNAPQRHPNEIDGRGGRSPTSHLHAHLAAGDNVPNVPDDEVVSRLMKFDTGNVTRLTLDNGLKIIMKPLRAFPSVYIRAHVEAGPHNDPSGKEGIAKLTGAMLDEGISAPGRDWNYMQIADFIEGKGAHLSTAINGISAKTLSRYLNDVADVVRDLLIYPSFPEDRFEKLKAETITEIKSRADNPRIQLMDKFREVVFNKTRLAHPAIGYGESVRDVSLQDIKDFFQTYYRPDNTIIVICGDFDPDKLSAKLRQTFASWKSGGAPPKRENYKIDSPATLEPLIIRRKTKQSHIALGHLGITRDDLAYPKLRILETILGRGPLSFDRLTKHIREEGGMAYEVWGMITHSADIHPGAFTVYIGTEAKNTSKAHELAIKVIREFADNGPTEEELKGAKEYYLRSLFSQWETAEGHAMYLLDVTRFNKPLDYFHEIVKSAGEMTLEDAKALSKRYIRPSEIITCIVGSRLAEDDEEGGVDEND